MAGAEPGVVGDVVVTLAHGCGGEFGQEVAHRFHHGVDVAGGAGDGLGEHSALQVEDAGGEIARLTHRGGEGGADHHLRLFLDHRDEAVPLDLALDFFQGVHGVSPAWRACQSLKLSLVSTWYQATGPAHAEPYIIEPAAEVLGVGKSMVNLS